MKILWFRFPRIPTLQKSMLSVIIEKRQFFIPHCFGTCIEFHTTIRNRAIGRFGDEKCSGKFDTKRLSHCLPWHRDFEREIKIIWLSPKRSFAQLSDKSQMRMRQRNATRDPHWNADDLYWSLSRLRPTTNKKVYTRDASVWVEQFIFYYYLSRLCVFACSACRFRLGTGVYSQTVAQHCAIFVRLCPHPAGTVCLLAKKETQPKRTNTRKRTEIVKNEIYREAKLNK